MCNLTAMVWTLQVSCANLGEGCYCLCKRSGCHYRQGRLYYKVNNTTKAKKATNLQLDADHGGSKATAEKFKVSGYPTLKFFPKGSVEPIDYDSGRSEEAILEFVNKHAGTHRVPGGGLGATAGRITALDEIVAKFQGESASIEKLAKEVKTTAAGLIDKYAPYYVRVLEKLSKSSDYAAKEFARLQRIHVKGGLVPEK